MSANAKDLWIFIMSFDSQKDKREKFTNEYCQQEIRTSLGFTNLEIDIKSINFWSMSTLLARQFQKGRVFLAGDAAHCVPPTGGYGMNIGIQDAHNLAWKLAYVLKNYAPPTLLKTYEVERKIQAQNIIDWSTPNHTRMREIFLAAADNNFDKMHLLLKEQSNHLNSPGLDLGFHYDSDAVAFDYEKVKPAIQSSYYQASSFPGFRAPHVWLRDSDKTLSTLDLFDQNYIFLTPSKNKFWLSVVKKLQNQTRIPLHIWHIGPNGDFIDDGNFTKVYELSDEACVLIRPDGHVAWRCHDAASYSDVILKKILFCDTNLRGN